MSVPEKAALDLGKDQTFDWFFPRFFKTNRVLKKSLNLTFTAFHRF
jgi:hypothetical protein